MGHRLMLSLSYTEKVVDSLKCKPIKEHMLGHVWYPASLMQHFCTARVCTPRAWFGELKPNNVHIWELVER